MKVGRWSTTPGSNNATPPDGWPEGQAAATVNDCAREMMAAIRTMIRDTQYIDKDQTPTFISTTSFSVPGNATSAIHEGRRLKLFDGTTIWGTVQTASFTTVTTIHLTENTGNLTTSLTSFAVAILSKDNNSLPRNLALTVSSLTALGNITGNSTIAATVHLGTGGTLSVSGAATMRSTLSVSGVVATSTRFAGSNAVNAFCSFSASGGTITTLASHNIASISRSASGVYRLNFSVTMASVNYAWWFQLEPNPGIAPVVMTAIAATTSFKFEIHFVLGGSQYDPTHRVQVMFMGG